MSKKRGLSEFLCRELLFDYITGKLDSERVKAVEESLEEFPELKEEIENLENGIKFSQSLNKIKVSEPLAELIEKEAQKKELLIKKMSWQFWPKKLKLATSFAFIVFISVVVYKILPQKYIAKIPYFSDQYTLAEYEKESQNSNAKSNQDVGAIETLSSENTTSSDLDSSTQAPVNKKSEEDSKQAEKMDQPEESQKELMDQKQDSSAVVRGEIYRAYMKSLEVDEVTPMIAKKILSMGGTRGGNVKIGWRRDKGSYFHFIIDKNKQDELITFLKSFSEVTVNKESHPRVMPKGKMRFILWLEEDNPIVQ